MNRPIIIEDSPPARWLTIPQLCAYLQVTPAEWNAWRALGLTPLHSTGPDGQLLVRAADLARWLDAHTIQPESKPTRADTGRSHRQLRAVPRYLARRHGRQP